MSEIRSPKVCGLFKPGHNPHWIQMNLAVKDGMNRSTPVRFIECRSDGAAVIETEKLELLLWNHEPERLTEAAAASGRTVEYQPRWGLLWVPNDAGRYAFCVSRSRGDHLPCSQPNHNGNPVQLLESAGAFTTPAIDPRDGSA